MGCFLGCFGGAKERRRRRKRSPAHSPSGRARATPRLSPKKAAAAAALDGDVVSAAAPLLATLLELRDSTDDLCLTVIKKKVTFDPNVTTYEAAAIPEAEEEDDEEAEPAAGDDKDEARWMLAPDCAKSEAFPLNHRYSNCAYGDNDSEYDEDEDEEEEEDEDEEEEADGLDECAIDDEDDDGLLGIGRGEDEACESLFLLPMSKTKESGGGHEAASGVTSPEAPPAPQQTRDANPVLSSVENLTQWKDAKARAATATAAPNASDKENRTTANLLPEPAIPAKKREWQVVCSDYSPSTPSKQEVSVDASLSTWLGSSGTPESNSVRSFSPISREDRPILGALTVEDIKISSANSSPRRSRSPSPSPDDMPILGTVGAYWNCSSKADPVTRGGFMRTRTRFGQDEVVNCY
ncbi:hypothetical protein OsI_09934 [Oryza sativa Indica Group]|uniref:Uncharacterized protein n=1 Tax=Oryza sativa subsp. indica TaxID=39946 RepID=A2XCA5_ORYSI|nr:hypothetical protein OsI_09934 [Oryza sativa Indica Group]